MHIENMTVDDGAHITTLNTKQVRMQCSFKNKLWKRFKRRLQTLLNLFSNKKKN